MRGAAPMDRQDYVALAEFRRALRQFLAFSDAATRAAGVTAQQYQAMLAIQAQPTGALAVKDLAEHMLQQHHGAVQLADRLAGAGLAERRASPSDGRVVLLALTGSGETLIADLAGRHRDALLEQTLLLAESLRRLRRIGPRTAPVGGIS